MKSSIKITSILVVFVLMVAVLFPSRLHAQTANFPDAAQVNADYPDDAQRFAAFNILYDDFSRHAPKPLSNADYAKSFSYQASSNMIATQQMSKDGVGSQAYRDFNTQCNQLFSDPNFTSSVVAKYNLPAASVRQIVSTPPLASPAYAPAASNPAAYHPPVATNPAQPPNHAGSTVLDHWGRIILGLMNEFPGVLFVILLIVFFGACSAVMALAAVARPASLRRGPQNPSRSRAHPRRTPRPAQKSPGRLRPRRQIRRLRSLRDGPRE